MPVLWSRVSRACVAVLQLWRAALIRWQAGRGARAAGEGGAGQAGKAGEGGAHQVGCLFGSVWPVDERRG